MAAHPSDVPLHWIGIDVSKAHLDVYDLSRHQGHRFTNNSEGISDLTSWLRERSNVAVVCEATGGYEQTMALQLHHCGVPVSIVNPRPVRDLAKAMGRLAKTDALDAEIAAPIEADDPSGMGEQPCDRYCIWRRFQH